MNAGVQLAFSFLSGPGCISLPQPNLENPSEAHFHGDCSSHWFINNTNYTDG